jgi:predicted permease
MRLSRLTSILVTAEIALTLTLLVAAGLMVRSLVRFQTLDMGIETDDMLIASLVLPAPKYATPASRVAFMEGLVERLQSTPVVAPLTLASHAPGGVLWRVVQTEKADLSEVPTIIVAPGYFNAIGANLLRGRDFSLTDGAPGRQVAIVNMQFASQHWPGEEPIGKPIRIGGTDAPWLTVVGVSSNVQVEDSEQPQGVVYTPYRQEPIGAMILITRSSLPHDVVTKTLRTEVQRADPDLPIFNVMTMDEYQAQIGVALRFFVWLFSIFSAIALLMSLIGVYAVTAYAVGQRTKEIGVRIALGATTYSIVRVILAQAIRQLVVGLTLGLAGALAMSRVLAGMLFHTAPTEGGTYLMVVLVFITVTMAACLIPARRVARIDAADSLRFQ